MSQETKAFNAIENEKLTSLGNTKLPSLGNTKLPSLGDANLTSLGNANLSSIENKEVDETTKKRRGIVAFVGSMAFSIVFIIMYFVFGNIFLSQANFYSRYKMTGRFANGPPYTTESPYKNIFTDSTDDAWGYRYMRWLTDSMITSFSKNRFFLDMFFDYLGKGLKDAPGFVSTIVLLIAPLIMILLVILSHIMGFIMTLVGTVSNISEVVPTFFEFVILALPLCIPLLIYIVFIIFSGWLLGTGIGLAQMIMMIGFLFILPVMDENVRQGVINSLIENKYILLLCIFSVMTMKAFALLDKTYGYVSLGITIASLLTYIFMKVM